MHPIDAIVATDDLSFRLLDIAEMEAAAGILQQVWGDPGLITGSLLRAYGHFGNPVIGAFDGDAQIGVCVGFLAPAGGVHLHSHITGVLPAYQHAGVGFRLKLEQREWCLNNGIHKVTWTFDPMLAKNAHFNLRKLGAVAKALLPDFYGQMPDAINSGDITDRLETHWHLSGESIAARPAFAAIEWRVEVPRDYIGLRASDPERAKAARIRVRTELAAGFDAGLQIVEFDDQGRYGFARLSCP